MLSLLRAFIAACLLPNVIITPASAGRDGNGGDREPAGGAFMTSYTEPGSTGVQQGGLPRSVDIPRYYRPPDTTGSVRPVPMKKYQSYRYRRY
jgi:hypothetical protein